MVEINRNAPVVAAAETTVHAPRDRVWSVLADIEGWTRWNPDVTRVKLDGPLAPGTEFNWTGGGLRIRSVLREVTTGERIGWTGRSFGIRATHVWKLRDTPDGTLVHTEESFDGFYMRFIAKAMTRNLTTILEKGLASLKSECERG